MNINKYHADIHFFDDHWSIKTPHFLNFSETKKK